MDRRDELDAHERWNPLMGKDTLMDSQMNHTNTETPKSEGENTIKTLLDQTQWDTIYALLNGIQEAADNGDPSAVKRLAEAAKQTMTHVIIGESVPYTPKTPKNPWVGS